jgi:hypothetical protein
MILAPPAGDAFNFVSDLAIYPRAFFTLAASQAELLASMSDEIQTQGHEEEEEGTWIDSQIGDKVEGVSCWWSQNHYKCQGPL